MVEDLRELVHCESPSGDGEALRRSAALLVDLAQRRFGSRGEVLDVQGVPHVRWRVGEGERRVLLLGHHDTVWPIGTLAGRLPWTHQDGIVRGPGCFDMKAGIVQMMHALRALDGRVAVTMLVTGDEEVGASASRELILAEARGCRAVLVAEPSADGGRLKVARKGAAGYRVEITGRAAHAGLEPERGVNAAVELAHAIQAVARLSDLRRGTTVTPTVCSAGTAANAVPDRAALSVDARATTAEEQRRVDRGLNGMRAVQPGAAVSVRRVDIRPPMEAGSARALFAAARRVSEGLGVDLGDGVSAGGASDGNFTAAAGVPTLDGLGGVGGGAHALDEHIVASAMPQRARLLELLIEDVLAGPAPGA